MGAIFRLINIPFSYVIKFFYSITGNYMLALLGFAIVVKIVLFPLGIKQQKNMVKQALLRPKELAIRAKYKGRDDQATQQKMQQEVMELYQQENYNPAGGCLPLIIQLIVIWAIYQIVYGPLTYLCSMSADALTAIKAVIPQVLEGAPDLLKEFSKLIKDGSFRGNEIQILQVIKTVSPNEIISALEGTGTYAAELIEEIRSIITNLPNMMLLGHDLSEAPSISFNILLLVPFLNLITTFLSTKITRKLSYQAPSAGDAQNNMSMKIMEYSMPLLIFAMAFTLPAALGVYWIYQNLLGILQQWILVKIYPYPTFTEEEIKEAQKAMNAKKPKPTERERDPNAKPVRSLHHIDDDEEYTPKEKKPSLEVPDEPAEKEDAPDSASGIDRAPLKK